MRAVRIHRTGGPDVLRLDDLPLSEPGEGEIRVRHTAIGINYIDIYHRSGIYPVPELPTGLGMEAAGVVEAVGTGVAGLCPGDRIAYASGPLGSYADFRVIRADRVVRIPEGIEDTTAAAMMLKGMTVEYLIRRTFPVRRGQTVLWHAAAGGVGLIACQWLRALGVRVIGTVSSDAKAELARSHGCTDLIIYTREDFVSRVRNLTHGEGVDVVYDSVGKTTFEASFDCLRPRGMLVGFGNASGKPPAFDPMLLAEKGSLYLTRPTIMAYTASREDLVASAEALFDVVRRGQVKIEVHQRWPLADVARAHAALESRQTTGSSVLLP